MDRSLLHFIAKTITKTNTRREKYNETSRFRRRRRLSFQLSLLLHERLHLRVVHVRLSCESLADLAFLARLDVQFFRLEKVELGPFLFLPARETVSVNFTQHRVVHGDHVRLDLDDRRRR